MSILRNETRAEGSGNFPASVCGPRGTCCRLDLGASAFSGTEKASAANIGLWALILYFSIYVVLIAVVAICAWRGWRIAGLFHSLIWLCLLGFAGTMGWSLMTLTSA